MSAFRTLVRLQPEERGLALRTLVLVAAIRLALLVLPFRHLQRSIGVGARLPLSLASDLPVSRLVWAVRAASRRLPGASCLTQSLALQCLLTRAGHRSQIHIGVTKDRQAGFQAHAGVEFRAARC